MRYFAFIFMIFINTATLAGSFAQDFACLPGMLAKHPEMVLSCYVSLPEKIQQPITHLSTTEINQVSIKKYTLTSQRWPKDNSIENRLWEHDFIIYQPKQINYQTALLFVSGGIRNQHALTSNDDFLFAQTAILTHSVIVVLKDVPNQYLAFDDHIPRKEDGIVAYTWQRYLDDPAGNAFWPVHLPMTKAVVSAMDAVETLTANDNKPITNFIVAGGSKRGWTTWLTAIADDRVKAIIPFVIDIFNMQENIDHIYETYQGWPEAFKDYVEQGVAARFKSDAFKKLIQIQDPIAYLTCPNCETYQARLSIPKYIISASQDQFFPPDSVRYFIDKIPGHNLLRMVPNESHSIDKLTLLQTIFTYYEQILQQKTLPTVKWQFSDNGNKLTVTSHHGQVKTVKLWQAVNPNRRDFRPATGVRYTSEPIQGNCDNSVCHYTVVIQPPANGWKAYFVELTYKNPKDFTATTPGFVIGR